MAKYHGKDTRLYIGGYDISSMMVSISPNREVDMVAYAVADGVAGYHQMPGLGKDSMSLDGIFDDNYQSVLNNLRTASTGYQIVIPFGSTIGDLALACDEVRLAKYNFKSIVTDVNRVTAELVAEDLPWDECELLYPKTQVTSDDNGTGLNHGSTSAYGLVAYLQVFECGADDDLVVKVQSDDNADFSSPTDVITFTTANGITTERKTASGTIEQYLRVSWSGTPAYQCTFAVVIKRNTA
jgi:hypothetical protein